MDDPQRTPEELQPVRYPVRFGTAELISDLDRPGGWMLAVDGVFQSYVDLSDPTYLDFGYLHAVAGLLDTVAEPGRPLDVVHLGVGAGTLPRYVAATRPGSQQRVVDVDGPLLDLVLGPLGLGRCAGIEATAADARDAVAAMAVDAPRSADVVVTDVFTGAAVPVHVTTTEFLAEADRLLRPDGLYVVNVADRGRLPFARQQAATLRAVFDQVALLAEPSVLRGRRLGNVVLAGAHRPLPVEALVRRLTGGAFPVRVVHGAALDGLLTGVRPAEDATAERPPEPSTDDLDGPLGLPL